MSRDSIVDTQNLICFGTQFVLGLNCRFLHLGLNRPFPRCYVLCWEGTYLKKICVGSQSLDQKVPDPELVPSARIVTCFEGEQLPVSVLGASPSLIHVLDDNRTDGVAVIQ